ncbi:MAG: hypothetical protein QXG39_00635 [Candidatus Aenigmatarchaeota archaeon]
MSWECYRNYGRMIAGYEILEMLRKEGIKISEWIYKIINEILNEYNFLIKFPDVDEINEIYSRVKRKITERYIKAYRLEKTYEKIKDFLRENIKI